MTSKITKSSEKSLKVAALVGLFSDNTSCFLFFYFSDTIPRVIENLIA